MVLLCWRGVAKSVARQDTCREGLVDISSEYAFVSCVSIIYNRPWCVGCWQCGNDLSNACEYSEPDVLQT